MKIPNHVLVDLFPTFFSNLYSILKFTYCKSECFLRMLRIYYIASRDFALCPNQGLCPCTLVGTSVALAPPSIVSVLTFLSAPIGQLVTLKNREIEANWIKSKPLKQKLIIKDATIKEAMLVSMKLCQKPNLSLIPPRKPCPGRKPEWSL